jgi:hypothetical protein
MNTQNFGENKKATKKIRHALCDIAECVVFVCTAVALLLFVKYQNSFLETVPLCRPLRTRRNFHLYDNCKFFSKAAVFLSSYFLMNDLTTVC